MTRTRRRSLPWIYRWSRPIIGAIAIAGAILTAYLTIIKLAGGEVACSANAGELAVDCKGVLDSVYAYPLGRSGPPLSLFGCLAYISMAGFALSPLLLERKEDYKSNTQLQEWTWLLLLAGSTAMAVFSGYLMYVLAFQLQTICYYCIGSALFSLTLLILTIVGREWEDIGQIFFTSVIVATLTLVATLAVYANVNPTVSASGRIVIPEPKTAPKAPDGWAITTTSTEAEIALAKHLTKIGAKKYGAFWCPHCYEQKQLFGKEAFKEINYIECAVGGKNPQVELCQKAGIKGFPTWEINGKLEEGIQMLDKLAELSGYQGSTNFKYTLPGFK